MNLIGKLWQTWKEHRALTRNSAIGRSLPLAVQAFNGENQVLGIPAAQCAVRVIAEAFSSCPAEIIETKDGEKNIVHDHELAYKLNVEVNPETSAQEWKQAAIHHAILWGNSYSEYNYRKKDDYDFWLLLPQYTQVMRTDKDQGNQLAYRATKYPSQETVQLDASECIHIRNMTFDSMLGIPMIMVSRLAFELAHAQESYATHWFKNNSQPGGILKFPDSMSQQAQDNIIESWKKHFSGSNNANRTGLLHSGGDFVQNIIPPDDGQWLNSRTFQISEIARIFNISPVFLHDLSNPWANLETLNTFFVQRTLIPWLSRFENEITRKVLGKSNLSLHFNVQGLLRGDIATRFNTYMTALQNGIYNIDEVRHKEGMKKIGPEKGGDVYRVQLNMASGAPGVGSPSTPNPADIKPDTKPEAKPDDEKREARWVLPLDLGYKKETNGTH